MTPLNPLGEPEAAEQLSKLREANIRVVCSPNIFCRSFAYLPIPSYHNFTFYSPETFADLSCRLIRYFRMSGGLLFSSQRDRLFGVVFFCRFKGVAPIHFESLCQTFS